MAAKSNNYVSVESDVMCISDNLDIDDRKLLENGLDELALSLTYLHTSTQDEQIIITS